MRKRNTIERIPKDTPYCYGLTKYGYYMQCPYLEYRKTDFGFRIHKRLMQYCKYLHKFLSIQDEVKDCGIGDIEDDR